ncbi:hypothetical protein CDAR_211471 [Caerostris darwini]|uniref:Uncharacterized protein n=1 Tax=Caerostris darwini TaxID=1538125 RepID=A0AAV4P3S0_9ARAC|nr:hypothetical protein CDAR_211471 [Caerostris darwini]
MEKPDVEYFNHKYAPHAVLRRRAHSHRLRRLFLVMGIILGRRGLKPTMSPGAISGPTRSKIIYSGLNLELIIQPYGSNP